MKRTWRLDDITDDRLHNLKNLKGFVSMNQTIEYLLDIQDKYEFNINNSESKLKAIDNNVQMLIEMVSWQCDKSDTIPKISVIKGYSPAFNSTKDIIQKNIEEQMRLKRESNIL